MKFYLSILSVFVLIYVIIYSVADASDEENPSVVHICERGLQYLKSKGLLDDSFPLDHDSIRCYSVMPETLPEMFNNMLEDTKEMVERKLPNGSECVTSELPKRQQVLDLLLTIRTVQLVGKLSKEEKMNQLIRLRDMLRQDLKEIAVKCDVETNDILSIFQSALE